MTMQPHHFGPFTLSAEERVVWRARKPVPLAPKAIDVLLVLLVDTERFVSKGDLIEAVWPEGYVNEANLTQTMYVLRCFFRDQKCAIAIENRPKRGYRLVVSEDSTPGEPEPDESDDAAPRPQWRLTRPTWSGAILLVACACLGAA
jgi:DNA-binding winged helix-turn-helix (wHTH) protein